MSVVSLSVQVIDGVYGIAAAGIEVRLDHAADGAWTELDHSRTGEYGQVDRWVQEPDKPGTYRLTFGTDPYFAGLGARPVYPAVTVEFRMSDPCCPHRVQLLLTPSSYLAYWQR